MELKTLKDLRPIYSHTPLFKNVELCSKFELKQEAIKWVKEDWEDFGQVYASTIIERWMKRLNIKEEDLK